MQPSDCTMVQRKKNMKKTKRNIEREFVILRKLEKLKYYSTNFVYKGTSIYRQKFLSL